MYFVVSLLYLQIMSTLTAKQGKFGNFKACQTNNSLQLKCFYAECVGSPPYHCKLYSEDPPFSVDKCNYTIPNHVINYSNETTRYNCTLIRKGKMENKTITINYRTRSRKDRIQVCRAGACSVQNQIFTSLWVIVILMWTVHQSK